MNPTVSLVDSQPLLTSDVAGVVMLVIALIYALLWWRDRDPGLGWFTLGWLGVAICVVATRQHPLGQRFIEWSPWWVVLEASLAALTIGLVDYLPLPEAKRRRTLLWVLFPLAAWFVVYSLPLLGLQIPRSLANLTAAAWYGALGAITWWAGGRERGAGHRIVAVSFFAILLFGVGLAVAQVDAPVLRFWAMIPIIVLALTLMPTTLLRRRHALESEVERRLAAETEVRALNAELEVRVQERTAQLQAANAELVAANDAAVVRHRALAAAQQAEARYRTLADWTPEVIAVHRDGVLLYANPATAALLGAASSQDLVGQSLLQFVAPAEQDFVRERIERVQRGEPGELIELPFAKIDGTRIEVETISILIEFDGQAAVYSWGRDITQRRSAERQAARLSGFYSALSRTGEAAARMKDEQSLFDVLCRICVEKDQALRADVVIIEGEEVCQRAQAGYMELFDPSLQLQRVNFRERPCLLTSQAILTGEALVCADYSTDPRTQLAHALGYGEGYRSQAVLPLRRGGEVCGALLLFAAEAGVFDEPIVELLLRMTAEVSFALNRFDLDQARLRALQEAEAGRDRFARVFHSAAMIATISEVADGTIVDINETACQHYGIQRENVIGHTLPSMGLGISAESRQALFTRLAREGRVSNAEMAFTTKAGEQLTLLVCGECIDWEGRQRLLLLANDITELRTADQVREKMRGAERANEAKTEFISRMSHELRTPLNAVLGFAQLLGEPGEPMTARQRSHLQRLHGGALHLQALVDDLIDIASIEAGRLKVAPEPVGLDAILASSIALCAAAAAQARVEVVIEGPHKNALLAMADPTRLRQVLANLVSNGIKYNRPGGHVIVRSEAYGELVVVDVTDDGLGMTDEQQQRLFTPYDRLGREGSGVAGTGIGLVLARQLVELMGGRLEVRSVAGQGTQLRIELPRAEDGESNTGFGSALATAGLEGTGLVLYVEDEPVNRLLVEQALGSCSGVELITAEDGASGLALARERRPDLVLLDMHLPDMNGLQVMSALRGHPATSGIPVVMLSASALAPDIDFARASGAVEYWTKPIDIKKLRAGVRRLLGVDH